MSSQAISRVGVVGTGVMAPGVVEVAALAGFEVVVRGRSTARAEDVVTAISERTDRLVAKGRMDAEVRAEALARITTTELLRDLAECDLVIEMVVEDLDIKRHLFAQIEDHIRPDAILASNTSTLPIAELALSTQHPERVCGLHFFNPATAMTLVEIIKPLTASDETIATVHSFSEACGREIVNVADHAGFVVNALLFPYLNSAIAMAERGTASIDDTDIAMRGGCGFPLGPFELLDHIGLDTSMKILETLHDEFGEPSTVPHPMLKRPVAAGHLGRKSGRGFKQYS